MISPDPSPRNPDDDVTRRLEALRSASESSEPVSKDQLPNIPAQKMLVLLARLLGNQVNGEKTAAMRYQFLESELTSLRERALSKDLFTAICGTQQDTLTTISEQMQSVEQRQQELSDLLVKIAAVFGAMLLGLIVVVGILAGGIR